MDSIVGKSVAAGTASTVIQFTFGYPSVDIIRVFVVNSAGCFVVNKVLFPRENERLAVGVRRGIGYGALAALMAIYLPPYDPLTFFVESVAASFIGSKLGPHINKAFGWQD